MEPDTADRLAVSMPWLDGVAETMLAATEPILGPDAPKNLKDALYGTWLGHPLHPAVIALPVGCWTATSVFDLIGEERAADATLNLGLASAGLAALSGLAQWRDATNDEAPRRLGALHALLNTAGTALYLGSSIARRNGNRTGGIALSTLGLAVTMASGWVGGELAYDLGVGVDRNAFESPPEDWTDVLAAADLPSNTPVKVSAGDVDVLLYKDEHGIHAIGNTCSHYGGPLNEGKIENDCVECPWHGSVFKLSDGAVVHGPATSPQPRFAATERDGRIVVRLLPPGPMEFSAAAGMASQASAHTASLAAAATSVASQAAEAASSAAGAGAVPDLEAVQAAARGAVDRVLDVLPGQAQGQGQGQGQGHDQDQQGAASSAADAGGGDGRRTGGGQGAAAGAQTGGIATGDDAVVASAPAPAAGMGSTGSPLDARAAGAMGIAGGPAAPPRYADAVSGNGTAECPEGYPIKGNADSGIYHQPHQGTYKRTIPEFCFKSTEAAEAAGYRALGQR